jgi:hypothetical protein
MSGTELGRVGNVRNGLGRVEKVHDRIRTGSKGSGRSWDELEMSRTELRRVEKGRDKIGTKLEMSETELGRAGTG